MTGAVIGIALPDGDALVGHAKPGGHDLSERGLVTLSIGLRREKDIHRPIVAEYDRGRFDVYRQNTSDPRSLPDDNIISLFQDRAYMAEIAAQGQQRVATEFSQERMVEKTLGYYGDVLARRARRAG